MPPIDKIAHFLAGAVIAAVVLPWGAVPALVCVSVVATAKEIWDAHGHGTPDRIDAIATVAGGATMLAWLGLVVPLIPV